MHINAIFYDIESLENVFTCAAFNEKENQITVWYLLDDNWLNNWDAYNAFTELCKAKIYESNKNFNGSIRFFDLNCNGLHNNFGIDLMAQTFGLWDTACINNRALTSAYEDRWRLVCDTDPDYDPEIHPYLMGYNSYNYDTTMLAVFLYNATTHSVNKGRPNFKGYDHVTAKQMREHNDELFSKAFKNNMSSYCAYDRKSNTMDYSTRLFRIRKNMYLSGRHVDIARLNEKQSKVALKRLLGMLGHQILESKKLSHNQTKIHNIDELCELIAYNCSDVVNLPYLLTYKNSVYSSTFELKQGMLKSYPELIYEKQPYDYKPWIDPAHVRRDRLYIDSSSAQLATATLCPYGHIKDIETVSFLYPAKEKAEELGIPQVNVLEETKKFFDNLFHDKPEVATRFQPIYDYYKSIEGKNFNDCDYYKEDYNGANQPAYKLSDMPKTDLFLPYFDKDGNETSCFVIFSTGGIHGAEYNLPLYQKHKAQYEAYAADFEYAIKKYPDPVELRKAKSIVMPDGRELGYNYFLRSGKTIALSEYKDYKKNKPELYTINEKGMPKLNDKYTYTSCGMSNHEDFESYYPNLLRMMLAFYNAGLGYDRYGEIFQLKQDYGKLMKDKSKPEDERYHYSVLRNGTKLVLNSASGAADALFKNNIRVNNQIISMRIIGQLFSWRIGQAQTFQGAKTISTNTDGLYTVMEKTLNNQILEKESADIGVKIEPESLFLISKDTNNRIECTEDMKITGASGGSVGCRKGPDPTKSLAHPAITDWALSEYLIKASKNIDGTGIDRDFDDNVGREILNRAFMEFDDVEYLKMMQTIVSSSPSVYSYLFQLNPNYHTFGIQEFQEKPEVSRMDDPIIPFAEPIQHYNRVFVMKDNTPDTVFLMRATCDKIPPATMNKRKKAGLMPQDNNMLAKNILAENGIAIPDDHEAHIKKITGLETTWKIYILNKDLYQLTEQEKHFLFLYLDTEKYLAMLRDAFNNNWKNAAA